METKLVAVDSIRPYALNPRINDKAVSAVAESIRQFGFRQPIVIDAEGVIVVGHTRWKAAKKLGLTEVPVHVATDLTVEQAKAYRIIDNKTYELASWDFSLLPFEVRDLKPLNLDLTSLGFSLAEVASLTGLSTPFDINTEWAGMPEYISEDKQGYKRIYVYFETREDYIEFQRRVGQDLTDNTKAIWFPAKLPVDMSNVSVIAKK